MTKHGKRCGAVAPARAGFRRGQPRTCVRKAGHPGKHQDKGNHCWGREAEARAGREVGDRPTGDWTEWYARARGGAWYRLWSQAGVEATPDVVANVARIWRPRETSWLVGCGANRWRVELGVTGWIVTLAEAGEAPPTGWGARVPTIGGLWEVAEAVEDVATIAPGEMAKVEAGDRPEERQRTMVEGTNETGSAGREPEAREAPSEVGGPPQTRVRPVRPIYVGARLAEAPLVREILTALAPGAAPTYDWTRHGSARGDPDALRRVAAAELTGVWEAGHRSDGLGVFLLAEGLGSPQRGVYVELGAFLAAGEGLGRGPRALVWVPPEHVDALDPRHPRALAFLHHPRVDLVTCRRDLLRGLARTWAGQGGEHEERPLPFLWLVVGSRGAVTVVAVSAEQAAAAGGATLDEGITDPGRVFGPLDTVDASTIATLDEAIRKPREVEPLPVGRLGEVHEERERLRAVLAELVALLASRPGGVPAGFRDRLAAVAPDLAEFEFPKVRVRLHSERW